MTENGILRKKFLGIFELKFRGGLTFGANLTLLHYHYKHFPRLKFTIIPFRCIFIEFDLVKMIFFGHVSFFGSFLNQNWLFLLNQSQFWDGFGLFGTSESVQRWLKRVQSEPKPILPIWKSDFGFWFSVICLNLN